MKNLRNKTFYTIFSIISLFACLFTIVYNVQVYNKEYNGILNNITRMRKFIDNRFDIFDDELKPSDNSDLYNRKVMDYEIYTFILDYNNNIIAKISHSDNNVDNNILNVANNILSKNNESKIKIGILYFNSYSYNLNYGNFLTIINIKNIRNSLIRSLLISILLILIIEIIIYIISKKITDWITKPVLDSFNREKEFIANASHELKTPLAVMMASVDAMDINKKNEKWINNLKSESDRMNNLITRLLDLSKSENYLTKENFTINDISKIIEKRALTFESLAYEKKVTIETNICEDIKLLSNKESIDELISILIDNAISHSYDNSKITVNLSKLKSEIRLEVINIGDNIPDGEQDKIFERFYRSDKSHNRKSNRYGLGLAIAKNTVEAHNGKIKAFSKDNYTTFRVIFKIKE